MAYHLFDGHDPGTFAQSKTLFSLGQLDTLPSSNYIAKISQQKEKFQSLSKSNPIAYKDSIH